MLSSPAFEWGIVITASAILNRRSNWNSEVANFLTVLRNPHNLSILQWPWSTCVLSTSLLLVLVSSLIDSGISSSLSNWYWRYWSINVSYSSYLEICQDRYRYNIQLKKMCCLTYVQSQSILRYLKGHLLMDTISAGTVQHM